MNIRCNLLKKNFEKNISVLFYFSKIAWHTSKTFFIYYLLEIVIGSVGPFFSIVGLRMLIDEISYCKRINRIIIFTSVIVFGNFIYRVIGKICIEKKNVYYDRINREVTKMINDTSMNIKYEQTENPETLNLMKKATKGYEQVGYMGIADTTSSLIANFIVLIGVVYIVLQSSIVLLVIITINFAISSILNARVAQINYEYFPRTINEERQIDYIANKLSSYRYGKDIRIYDASNMLIELENKLALRLTTNSQENYRKVWEYRKYYQIIENILIGGQYTFLGIKIIKNRITVGEFSGLISAISTFMLSLEQIVNTCFEIQKNTKILDDVIKYISMKKEDSSELKKQKVKKVNIEFKNVSFKYPNTKNYILKNINLKIIAGEHIAIVGENGAGKTTFIKLICRLYDVTEGEILLNGKNIKEYKWEEYTQLLAVVFQDFKLLAFSIRENIELNNNTDNNRLENLCKMAGIYKWIENNKRKYDTLLYKIFSIDGVEPSGGQAQKIAIVRALNKNAPLIILDEPTAALDPISEFDVYNKFNRMIEGKTAIYISHRLSSCVFCDRILVFADKMIKEEGTHEELLKNQDGIYSKMYKLQSKYYSKSNSK